jgi:glutaconate CoA-transferase subunit A
MPSSMTERNKLMPLSEAVGRYVHDGQTIYFGGFIQQEPFAAAHEIIRQRKKDLTISKCAGMLLADQLIGAGAVKKLITAFCWNPLPAPTHCFVRALTKGGRPDLELEEYSILGLNLAYLAGAMDLPYVATKTMLGTGFDEKNRHPGLSNRLRFETSPFSGERVCLIPPIKHDLGILQVQRSDSFGNAQAWGMLGETLYGIQSCEKIIVCAEKIVETEVIQRDPNRTLIPGFRVTAVVEEPWGSHPASMAGWYDMDWPFSAAYERQTRTEKLVEAFLQKWVFGVDNRQGYLKLLGRERLQSLRPHEYRSDPVSYGKFNTYFKMG